VPTNLLGNPEHWRQRAEETRLIAESACDQETKRLLLNLVESIMTNVDQPPYRCDPIGSRPEGMPK
jgi:hypothetical protein